MNKDLSALILILILTVSIYTSSVNASLIYPLDVFTSNGDFSDSSDLNLFVEVKFGVSTVDFELHNESVVDSSIARIYFDDSLLVANGTIIAGTGTLFGIPAVPAKLPAANLLGPSFETDFGFDADAPGPHNGINPGQQVTINFGLTGGTTFADIANALNNGSLRIGVHVISLPDGSSESAVNIPEPSTLLFLGLGGLMLRRKR